MQDIFKQILAVELVMGVKQGIALCGVTYMLHVCLIFENRKYARKCAFRIKELVVKFCISKIPV